MTPAEFWQNFKLGEEQEIACNFIYDGLRSLHEMDSLSQATEVFPVLYNLSIGIERLLKVAVTLLEFTDSSDVEEFEKSLITHNHMDLLNRIKAKVELTLGECHIALLTLLSTFYKTHRYDRFNFSTLTSISKDKEALHAFLHKYLQIDIREEFPVIHVENSSRIKKFIGKTVKKLTKQLYSVIEDAATTKNIYTYEISSSGSKAAKILWGDDSLTFEDEEIAMVESLVFLIKTKDSGLMDFVNEMEPLPLDPALDSDYLQVLLRKKSDRTQSTIDEIESHYEDMESEDVKERLERIKLIKDPSVHIESDSDVSL